MIEIPGAVFFAPFAASEKSACVAKVEVTFNLSLTLIQTPAGCLPPNAPPPIALQWGQQLVCSRHSGPDLLLLHTVQRPVLLKPGKQAFEGLCMRMILFRTNSLTCWGRAHGHVMCEKGVVMHQQPCEFEDRFKHVISMHHLLVHSHSAVHRPSYVHLPD